MRTVNAKCGSVLPIGRLGENEATVVVFDIASWKSLFGQGTFSLLNQRNGDTAPYPCVIEQDNTKVRWTVQSADVAVVGYGQCEIIYTVGDTIAKSEIYTTVVGKALTGGTTPPEPWEDWVQRVLAEGERVKDFLDTLEGGTTGQVWTKDGDTAHWADPQGGGGTGDHTQLTNRDAANQHPMSAITGLETALSGKQATITDLATIRSGAELGATALQSVPSEYVTETELQAYHDTTKQDVISDLQSIRTGAAAGATAVQPSAISDMATQTWVSQQGFDTATSVDAKIQAVQDDVDGIAEVIPSDATAQNKLVSTSQMGDAISSVEAKQLYSTASQGSFATKAALTNATTYYNADGTVATPTKNDVAYVLADESHSGKSAKYVIAQIVDGVITWGFVITFSDTTFTQAQMDAINSGATSDKVSGYDAHVADGSIHVTAAEKTTWNGKYDKPADGIPATDLTAAVQASLGKADTAAQPPTVETYAITAASWTALSGAAPYTVYAEVTATHTIGANTVCELINNQAVLFANYGFAIGAVSGQTVTFYATKAPTSSVTLEVEFYA